MLESASPGLKTEAERAERRRLDAQRAAELEADFKAFLDRWVRLPIFASLDADGRAAFTERRRRGCPAELARSLRGSGTGRQPPLWAELSRLAVPTLAVAGAADAKFAELAFALSVAGPPVVPMVASGGHAVHAERPRLFAAILREFLHNPVSASQVVPA